MSHPSNDGKVMGDEQDREPALALQLGEQVEDLRLNGDIERRRRFVRDNHGRVDGESARDGDPLALSAGELVWQALSGILRQTDPHR